MLFVFDTNALVSAILKPLSVPAIALSTACEKGILVFSEDIREEITEVIGRKKFDKYVPLEIRKEKLRNILANAQLREALYLPNIICRDAKDIKFLLLATNLNVDCIISGDIHLTEIGRFQNIPILNPASFLVWIDKDNM